MLAITEDIHDVFNLGKEAAAVHLSLMEDLSKVFFVVILPMVVQSIFSNIELP